MREPTVTRQLSLFTDPRTSSPPPRQQRPTIPTTTPSTTTSKPALAHSLPRLTLNISKPLPNSHHIPQTTHEAIQATWSAFDSMSDRERDLMLKGLVMRCSEKQVEGICTWLNLWVVENGIGGMVSPAVHPENAVNKYTAVVGKPKWGTGKSGKRLPNIERGKSRFLLDDYGDSPPAPVPHLIALDGGFGHHRPTTQQRATNTNISLFIKLLNTAQDPTTLVNQLSRAGPDTTRAFIAFLTTRLQKFRNIFKCLCEVASEGDAEKGMERLVEEIMEAVGAEYGCLWSVDNDGLNHAGADGNEEQAMITAQTSNWTTPTKAIPISSLFTGPTLLTNTPTNTYNIPSSEQFTTSLSSTYTGIPSTPDCILSTPITDPTNKVVGILELINKRNKTDPPYFDTEDEFLVRMVCGIWRLLMVHFESRREANEKTADLRAFLNGAKGMVGDVELGDLITVIMQTATELCQAERCSLFMVDRENGELWTTVAQGTQEIRVPMNKGIAGHVAMTGQVLNIANAYSDPRFNRTVDLKTGFRTRNILCMPLKNAQGTVIGVTQVINKLPEGSVFGSEDEMLLGSFAGLAGGMLEKSIHFKALQHRLETITNERDALQTAHKLNPHIIMTLDYGGRLQTINNPQALFPTTDISVLNLTSYDTWLSGVESTQERNQTLINDITRCYQTGKRCYGVNYGFVRENGVVVVGDYVVDRIGEGSGGVVVVFQIVDEEKRMVECLGRYMATESIHAITSDPTSLAGKQQQLTVLYAEIRDFPTIIESLSATQTLSLLTQHYTSALSSVTSSDGFIHAYTPPTITSIFGLTSDTHSQANPKTTAINSITAALRVRSAIKNGNMLIGTGGQIPKVEMGIGVCTGDGVYGVVKGAGDAVLQRDEFVVVGGPTATTQTLTMLIQTYYPDPQTTILIDSRTKDLVKDYFHIRELDAVYLTPSTKSAEASGEPETIYEILGAFNEELDRDLMTAMIHYELGLTSFRAAQFPTALTHFRKSIQLTNDGPARTMSERCRKVTEGGVSVGDGWDGIWAWG